jgi:hypothetical protein
MAIIEDKDVGDLWLHVYASNKDWYESTQALIRKLVEELASSDCESMGDVEWDNCKDKDLHRRVVCRRFGIDPATFPKE